VNIDIITNNFPIPPVYIPKRNGGIKNIMKKNLIKGMVVAGLAVAAVMTYSLTSVSAASVYDEYALETTYEVDQEFTLEEMLNYAIQDEYMAQAEYQAIIATYGELRPFTNIVEAEQTHIDLLLPLFAAYGYTVPENTAANNVVIPDSITSALSTGIAAEEANIAMYQAFLGQDNLPDDVRLAFEYLVNASARHLQAFSGDHYAYYGQDLANQIKNQFKKMFKGSNGSGTGTGSGSGNQNKGSSGSGSFGGYDGTCPNA